MTEIDQVLAALDYVAKHKVFQAYCKAHFKVEGVKPFVNTRDQTCFEMFPDLRPHFNTLTDWLVDVLTMNDTQSSETTELTDVVMDLVLNPEAADRIRGHGYTVLEKDGCFYVECGYAVV